MACNSVFSSAGMCGMLYCQPFWHLNGTMHIILLLIAAIILRPANFFSVSALHTTVVAVYLVRFFSLSNRTFRLSPNKKVSHENIKLAVTYSPIVRRQIYWVISSSRPQSQIIRKLRNHKR